MNQAKVIGCELHEAFMSEIENWISDESYVDVRYIAGVSGSQTYIWDAVIFVSHQPNLQDNSFEIKTNRIFIGQQQAFTVKKQKVLEVLQVASCDGGVMSLDGGWVVKLSAGPDSYYSEMGVRSSWFSPLHLEVIGSQIQALTNFELAKIDSDLRSASLPFDGLNDAANWLGLRADVGWGSPPKITLHVMPPVDLIFDKCELHNGTLKLIFSGSSSFDVGEFGVAVIVFPRKGLNSMVQLASQICWGSDANGSRTGVLSASFEQAEVALVMLSLGGKSVRRQWFSDPNRAGNSRLLTIRHFDPDMKRLTSSLLDTNDSNLFEKGIAELLFLLNFVPCQQVETDAPDLVVTTPEGRIVLVECTLKTHDFSAKLGKLTDRRVSLSKALKENGYPLDVSAVLVCRVPRDQLLSTDLAKQARVVLITLESIRDALVRINQPAQPDQLLDAALKTLD